MQLIYDQVVAALGDPLKKVKTPALTPAQQRRDGRKVLRWQRQAISAGVQGVPDNA